MSGRSIAGNPAFKRWQSEPPSTVTAVYHEVFLHGPVAAHCMIVLKPEVPRCRLNWSFSCTVNAPSMIPAIDIVVATTWRSDMGSHSDNTLPRPLNLTIQDRPFMFRSAHTQSMTGPIRSEIIRSNQCVSEGYSVTASAPVLAMCRKLIEARYDPATPLHAYRGDTLCARRLLRLVVPGFLSRPNVTAR